MVSLDKIQLYMNLFTGRRDVYARRWERNGKSGYSPAYSFSWPEFMAHKEHGGTMANFTNKTSLPMTMEVIQKHLEGDECLGLYPLRSDGTCHLIAVDFDKTFGFETSLSLYKTLEKAYGSVKVTVFSETKNLYSIIDAAKIEDEKKAVKIYIGTGTSSEISDYNITIVENGKVSASLQYAGNAVSSGTYVSSMDKMYTNVPLYKTKLKSLKDILSVGSVAITDIGAIQREKTGIVIKKISMDVKNTFVERCSKK